MSNPNEEILALVTSGLSVIPITEGAKNPHQILGPKHELFVNRPTEEDVAKWIAKGVKSWGVAGGAVSGNLVTLDFDEKHYAGLYDLWYAKLSDDLKRVVDTCHKNSTRNKGMHLRYRTQTTQPTSKLASRVELNKTTNKEGIETTAETRGEGSYALIPPSDGYITTQGSLLALPLISDEIHEQLIDILRTFNEVEDEPEPEYKWAPSSDATGDRPGDKLARNMTWNEILEPHGWIEESKDHWRRPGKTEGQGISATTNYDNRPMFYVFSSSAAPFKQNKGYSKFHVYTLLNHGGDFIAAARSALEKYPEIQSKPEPQNEKVVVEKLHLWTIGEILSHDFGTEDWLVENLISKQGMTALSGNPGDYKTWVTIHIALCITRNTPVFGNFLVAQGGVLVIDEEDHMRVLKRRLELLGAKETDNIHYLSQNCIKMDEAGTRDAILKIVQEKNLKS